MHFYGEVLGSTINNGLNFGGAVGILRWVNEQQKHHNSSSITRFVVEVLIQNLNLSPPRLSIFTLGNIGVMMCLGQGGLRLVLSINFESMILSLILAVSSLQLDSLPIIQICSGITRGRVFMKQSVDKCRCKCNLCGFLIYIYAYKVLLK